MDPADDTATDLDEDWPAAVFCLRTADQPEDHYLEQVHALAATDWGPTGTEDEDAWIAQATAAIVERTGGEPAHLVVSGRAVPRALRLAVQRPDLVISVLAGDPQVDESDPAYWDLLRSVHTPTLVLVAAPDEDTDISQAQTVAGGVDNGVMVVLDGHPAPVHRSATPSFHEWITSFMSIAEGLRSLTTAHTPAHKEESHA